MGHFVSHKEPLLSVAHAARLVGLTPAAVKTHDRELAPLRDSAGRRSYEPAAVFAWLGRRHAAAAARKASR
jgi:hypothetical protein